MSISERYRGWLLDYDPKPIPDRSYDWIAISPNYDASWEGEEAGWVDNGEKVHGATYDEVCAAVDEWFADNGPFGVGA